MLVSVFELLADARAQVDSVNAAIEAQRDFWIAETDLQAAINGSGGAPAPCAQRLPAKLLRQHIKRNNHGFTQKFFHGRRRHGGRRGWSAASARPRCRRRRCMDNAATQAPLTPPNGRPYNPVVTLNGWSLPWRMNDGVKEFHLVAEPVVRELAPGMKANLWGYNGQSPGPDHRSRRRRPRAHLRHQQAARAHQRPLARPAPAERHGRRRRPDPAAASRPARPSSTNSSRGAPAPSCTTRTPTR